MVATEPSTGIWECAGEAYHADLSHVSHSALEVARKSWRRYHGRYVTGTIPPRKETPELLLGSALHCAVLEPDRYEMDYCQVPDCDRRTTAGKKAWEEFKRFNAGRISLDATQATLVNDMADAILCHSFAAKLLESPGAVEMGLRWFHSESGIACKIRPDKQLDAGVTIDIKTTGDASPDEWARSANTYGFHRQSAFYRCGRREVLGVAHDEPFLHIVVSKEPPHEVGVYELDYQAWMLGDEQISRLLKELAERRASDNWANEWECGVRKISLPRWAFNVENQ